MVFVFAVIDLFYRSILFEIISAKKTKLKRKKLFNYRTPLTGWSLTVKPKKKKNVIQILWYLYIFKKMSQKQSESQYQKQKGICYIYTFFGNTELVVPSFFLHEEL